MTPRQLAFDLDARPSLGRDDFLIAPPNVAAVKWIDAWPDWPAPVLILHGPPGSGKTHLTRVFMAATGATEITGALPAQPAAGVAYVIESAAERLTGAAAQEQLFHFYNDLKNTGGSMLLTAEVPPKQWPVTLADLTSRLLAAPCVEIGRPDDALLGAVLVKLFSDRQIRIDTEVIAYAVNRMERSFAAASHLVAAADELALALKQPITVALLRRLLDR